ncbi:MAG: hypothetical protein LBJ72_07950 [Dysgonamonadaceae bacterium]|jgi:hypothetical protein|nr:hypothetical protein [Dysgonamonadaceae bacterium]
MGQSFNGELKIEENSHLYRRNKEDNFYQELQNRSLEMIQQLSGNLWTDFNEHDPGVTLMDALNYALYDLHYQTHFSFEEYLNQKGSGTDWRKSGLFPAHVLFDRSIVTCDDYEQLFLSSIEGIKTCEVKFKKGYYEVAVDLESGIDFEEIHQQIRKMYHQNRNLCENLGEVKWMQKGKNRNRQNILQDIEYHEKQVSEHTNWEMKHEYYSVRNELPDCYGVNEKGLPPGASKERKARAMQLNGYLSIFDYLLMATKNQIAQTGNLMELSEKIPPKFKPVLKFNDWDKLLDEEKMKNNTVFDSDFLNHQKSLYFDYLDMLYGEDTAKLSGHIKDVTKRNQFRAKLIRFFPQYNTHRFRSFNLTDSTLESIPEIKKLAMMLSENKIRKESPSIKKFTKGNYQIIIQKMVMFYLIEHLLLVTEEEQEEIDNYRLTVVISDLSKNRDERKMILNLFEERLPAHLDINYLWLETKEMHRFENFYFRWRKAWAGGDLEQVFEMSEEMRNFLN